jgi:hypothetical protein
MKKYNYTFLLLLGFLLSSCELTKVVKPKLKEDAPKIVIDAKLKRLLHADGEISSEITVLLSRSQVLNSYEDTKISAAQIQLLIGEATVLDILETEKGVYQLDLNQTPEDNQTLALRVSTNGKTYTANSYFPAVLSDFSISVVTRKPNFSTEVYNVLNASFIYPAPNSYFWLQATFEPLDAEKIKYQRAEKLSEFIFYPSGPDDSFVAAVGSPINPIFFARTLNKTEAQKEETGVLDISMDNGDKALVTVWSVAKGVYTYYQEQQQVQGSFNSTIPYNPSNNFKNREVLGNFSVLNGLEKEFIYAP